MSALRIFSIALIGKHSQPLYVKGFTSSDNLLKWNWVAHCSLDYFEERDAARDKPVDAYLGMLYSLDEYAVYGYQTNTRVRIVLVIALSDTVVRDVDVKAIFRAIHTAYIDAACNPFASISLESTAKAVTPPISSKRFDAALETIVQAHAARPT